MAYYLPMRFEGASLRRFVACVVAALFVLAAEPGTMAMNAPMPAHHGMQTGMPCHGTIPQKHRSAPCKGMTVCLGMLSCHGMTAHDAVPVLLPRISSFLAVAPAGLPIRGITHRPDNPPPIA
jgi:hypothetical protein